ncbi:MAG: hypothetical protein AAF804_05830 [Bacteroidota bacterium]
MGFAQSVPLYQESGGLVIIELESAVSYGLWELESSRPGFTGEGYLHYNGTNYYNQPGNSLLKFEIAIEKAGKYRFQWHSLIAVGQSNTEHNDSWLRFRDASDFYGEKEGQRVYPKGTGKSPNPEGSSADGWLKIYQNSLNNWTWATRTSDRDPHDIYVEFDTAGVYTLEISGRSTGHAINRLALYHSDVSSTLALNLNQPESSSNRTTHIKRIPVQALTIRPTLAGEIIYVDLPSSAQPSTYEGHVLDGLGRSIQSISFPQGSTELSIPVSHLTPGLYVMRLKKGSVYFQGRFIKQ